MKKVLSALTMVGCMVVSLSAMAAEPLSLPPGSSQEASKHNEQGVSFYKQGNYEEALKHFDASEDVARTATVYYNEGLTYDKMGRSGKARMHFEEAQQLEQQHALSKLNSPISKADVLKKYNLLKN